MGFTKENIATALVNASKTLTQTGYENILNKRKGIDFDCTDVICAEAIIKLMGGFVPESTIISGTQARISFTLQSLEGSDTFTLEVTSGSPYAFYEITLSGSASANATAVANYINSLYPASYPYTAQANGSTVTVSGINYDADNGTIFTVTIPKSEGGYLVQHKTMSGGEEAIYQDNNCITDQEAETLLFKLQKLVSPCEPLDESLIN